MLAQAIRYSSFSSWEAEQSIMVLQMIHFYEDRLGRAITLAERDALKTMYEEFQHQRARYQDRELALNQIGGRSSLTSPEPQHTI